MAADFEILENDLVNRMLLTAVILAGGEGTRLRPVTYEIPKPLVPVRGKAIITWQVRLFQRHGVKRIFVVITPKWKQAFEAWKDACLVGFGADVQLDIQLWEEHEPMGTLGVLVHDLGARIGPDPFYVTNGDELKGFDLAAMETFHRQQRNQDPQYAATIALVTVPNPSDYGVAEMQGDRIVHFHEKPKNPPSCLINSGLYIIESPVLQELDQTRTFLMFEKDLFPFLTRAGRLGGCPLSGSWYDCGTMERWEQAIHEWGG